MNGKSVFATMCIMLCCLAGCTSREKNLGKKYNAAAVYYNTVVETARQNAWNSDEDFVNTINNVASALQSVKNSIEEGNIDSEKQRALEAILENVQLIVEECEKKVSVPYDMKDIPTESVGREDGEPESNGSAEHTDIAESAPQASAD